jgi:hypothetical protein
VVREEALKPVKFEAGPPQQPVFYGAKRLAASTPGVGDESSVEVGVGAALDWRKHSQSDGSLWEAFLPEGQIPTDGVLTARIIGGKQHALARFDWAEVNAVEWSSDGAAGTVPTVTIFATVWRRPYIHGNTPTEKSPRQAFAVPLATEGLVPLADLAKTVKVRVVWAEGVDNPRNAVSEIRR